MQVRRDQGPKSFGRRRPMAEPAGPDGSRPVASAGLLAWSLRVTAVIGLVAVAGATQLARWNRPGDGSVRMADGTSSAPADPETTGAVTPKGAAWAARGTHLDPCLLPAAERLRP